MTTTGAEPLSEAARLTREVAGHLRQTGGRDLTLPELPALRQAVEDLAHEWTLRQIRIGRALAEVIAEAKHRGEYRGMLRRLAAEGITAKDLRRALRLPPAASRLGLG
jgi:hypothetical protein